MAKTEESFCLKTYELFLPSIITRVTLTSLGQVECCLKITHLFRVELRKQDTLVTEDGEVKHFYNKR